MEMVLRVARETIDVILCGLVAIMARFYLSLQVKYMHVLFM